MRTSMISILIIAVSCLSSCSNNGDVAKELVENFFIAATDSTACVKIKDIYPQFDSLGIAIKRDVLDINDAIQKKGDTIIVSGQNSYTGEDGIFKQDSVKFYIHKDKNGKFKIVNSEGLIITPTYLKDFVKQIDLKNSAKTDIEKNKLLSDLNGFYRSIYIDAYIELRAGVKVSYWDWETDYSNEPHGQAWIINNTNLTIRNIKYNVKYYDRNKQYISDDNGNACSKLSPGEKYRFTFYSTHVKGPSSANLSIDFADSNVDNIIASKQYTVADFNKYCKDNK